VRGQLPDGKPFEIHGTSFSFGPRQTEFRLNFEPSLHGGTEAGGAGILEASEPPPRRRLFSPSFADECPPHETVVVYGLLPRPGASVLARTPSGFVPLTKVPIARRSHARGPLVYGVFTLFPSELIVRSADGKTLSRENLLTKAHAETEFCEGFGEG
jgi:hypothetical protein